MIFQVILGGDCPVFRAGIRAAIQGPDVKIVAECETGDEIVATAARLRADLVILGLPLPDMTGSDAISELIPHGPPPYILVMSDRPDDQTVLATLKAGARGFLSKDADTRELLNAVRLTATGGGVLSPVISERLGQILRDVPRLPAIAFPTLTRREREVLELIGRGYDNRRISRCLVLSDKTVRNHVSNILVKLQVTSRTAALVMARNAGLGADVAAERKVTLRNPVPGALTVTGRSRTTDPRMRAGEWLFGYLQLICAECQVAAPLRAFTPRNSHWPGTSLPPMGSQA